MSTILDDLELDEPTAYLPEPHDTGFQDTDDVDEPTAPRLGLLSTPAKLSPVDFNAALAFERGQHADATQSWLNLCQSLCRHAYQLPALYGSAYAQWLGLDPEDRHVGGTPDDAPLGAPLFFKGTSAAGHVMNKRRPFKSGATSAWSNDLVRAGGVDAVLATAPETHWGQKYLGYGRALNGYDLQLGTNKPPAPKQTKRYKAIGLAIDRLGDSLATAQKNHDAADVKALNAEIKRLEAMYARMRRA
jgi:hypothetical protein